MGVPSLGGSKARPAGFTLLAVLVIVAALMLVVSMALQRGEDERRSAYQVQHDTIALSAAEFGLERTRAYVGSILDNEADLDRALDPALDTPCGLLPLFDGGTADDNLPTIDGGTVVTLGTDQRFLSFPYQPGDGGVEGAYLVRIDDNDDDADGTALLSTTDNHLMGSLLCKEGPVLLATPARTNPVRDRDRTVVVTVVGIAPGTDVTRAQARKVLRARIGNRPSPGIITGGSIELNGASHVCGAYGSISVSNGGFDDGCVCGASCHGGPAPQSCGSGNSCDVQVANSTCSVDFGGGGGTCITNAPVPVPPKVEVWSKLNAPPACYAPSTSCVPFYYLRADKVSGLSPSSTNSDKAQVYMWKYAQPGCENPQAFSRIYYPGELFSPAASCWKLVYDGNSGCPGDRVRMKDEPTLSWRDPFMTTVCTVAPTVWKSPGTSSPVNKAPCDDATTTYPNIGDNRYWKNWVTGGAFTYDPDTSPTVAPIPHGVWFVDGDLTFKHDTPDFGAVAPFQQPVTLLSTGNVLVNNNTTVRLRPANRDVAVLAGRDMELKGGNAMLLTCGDPTTVLTNCPSAAIMVHEQFTLGSNTHLQGQLVVQNASTCSTAVQGKAIDTTGNGTISVPAPPPIAAGGGASVLSWEESSL